MPRVLVRLERPPLVEAVLELRFSTSKESIGDLLPGLLYGTLKQKFERAEPLPVAAIPREVRLNNPDLRYRPHLRLSGKEQALLVGDHVATISKSPPYSGWEAFRALCQEVFEAIRATELIDSVERLAFKCVNILDLGGRQPFALFNGELRLAAHTIGDRGFRLRAEIDQGGFTNIIECASVATMEVNQSTRSGLLLSIDTLRAITSAEFWPAVPKHIDAAHTVLKELFLALLKPTVVEEYGPIWSEP